MADNRKVFANLNELGERRTVIYDGNIYQNIPVILSPVQQSARNQRVSDHVQGIFRVSTVMHCIATDIGGKPPEKGSHIKINHKDGDGGFFYEYTVASSADELGLLRIELEALDE